MKTGVKQNGEFSITPKALRLAAAELLTARPQDPEAGGQHSTPAADAEEEHAFRAGL